VRDTAPLRDHPIAPPYAVRTGIGATGKAIVGMILFKEPRHALSL
jgi:multidrug transporter EmrE-like cation transporter